MGKKAVFFDIDGTLWDENNFIPKSVFTAVEKIRKNGVLTFICSGRCRGYITSKELFSIGFDGVVSGCGTMVEYGDDTIFYREMDNELSEYTVETIRKYGFRPVLEGKRYLYMDDEEFANEPYGRKLKAEMGENLLSIKDNWGKWEISKFSCATDNADMDGCFKAMEKYYDFMVHNEFVTEFVPKGFHKGTGIIKVCDYLGIDIGDTYAVGDSVNDLGMLKTAGHAIVMGNGQARAKELAEFVTTDLYDDGIYNAMKHYELCD